MTGSDSGWLEAAIAWEVCASLHRQYCKGKDALFTTRQSDFVQHAENARGRAPHGQAPAPADSVQENANCAWSNDELTAIYNEANGITVKNPPITTERIFAAMRWAAQIAARKEYARHE